jgi:hypothetical protein
LKQFHGVPSVFSFLISFLISSSLAGCGGGIGNTTGTTGCTSCSTKSTHYVAIADSNNNRVLIFTEPLGAGENPAVVLGAPDFTSTSPKHGQSGLSLESGLAFDFSGNLFVADTGNHRVLEFVPPFSSGMGASMVFGQSDFIGDTSSSTASGLFSPSSVAIDASGDLWVADLQNSRVLEYRSPLYSGMAASVAIGQSTIGNTQFCNQSGSVYVVGNPTASTLCEPVAMTFDVGGNLWISDGANNRVLEYAPPFSTGMAAMLELGHATGTNAFTSYRTNDGGGVAGNTLWYPAGLAFNSNGNLWVTDDDNNRILEFVPPFNSGMPASLVLGQPDFTHDSPGSSWQSSILEPFAIALDTNGNLLVADTWHNRVLVFTPPLSSGMNAGMVLGQPNLTSNGCSLSSNTICIPMGVATF